MPVVASMDTQRGAAGEGSASRRCVRFATTGGMSDRQGAAVRVRDGCALPTHSCRRGDSGRRQVGAALFSVAVRVPGRAERQDGIDGA
jgi:hypothetical protein